MDTLRKLERGRRCPATRSSGGATGVNDDRDLEKNRAQVSD